MALKLWERRRARAAGAKAAEPPASLKSMTQAGFRGSNVPAPFPFSPPIAFPPQNPTMRVRRTQVTDLFAPYPIMERIASNLQIEDLHNLALTSQAAYDHIGARLKTLRNLEQMAECKGRGAEWGRDIDIPWIYSWAEYVPDEVFECTGTGKEVCETCNATICDGCRFKAEDTNAFYLLPDDESPQPWVFAMNQAVLYREVHYVWVCSDCVPFEPVVAMNRWAECDCGEDHSYYWWRYHIRPSCYDCRIKDIQKRSKRAQALWHRREDIRDVLRTGNRYPLIRNCACGHTVGERNFVVLCPYCRKRVRRIKPDPPQQQRPLTQWDWYSFWLPPPALIPAPRVLREFKGKVVKTLRGIRDGWRKIRVGEHW